MKKLHLEGMAFAAGLSALCAGGPVRAQGDPAIRIEEPKLDFGAIVFGQPVSHTFVVSNQGGSPLLLQEVVSKCDCFHATFEKTIAPGQTGRIETSIDTSQLQGPVFLTVVIRSNDPVRKIATLEIKGFVNGPIMLLPRDHLDLTTVAGENREQVLFLEVNRKRPLKVRGVESTSTVFAPSWEASTPGRRYRIVVKANGSQAPGLHRGTIRIRTDDKQLPIVPVECSLLVLSSVAAEPGTLFLPPLGQEEARKGKSEKSWKVVVRNLRNRPFTIVSVTSDVPFVHAWNQARSDGSSYEVFVEIRPNDVLRPGRTITNLHVKTSLPDGQDVKVPVWVEVR